VTLRHCHMLDRVEKMGRRVMKLERRELNGRRNVMCSYRVLDCRWSRQEVAQALSFVGDRQWRPKEMVKCLRYSRLPAPLRSLVYGIAAVACDFSFALIIWRDEENRPLPRKIFRQTWT
jgi:hypothetical protein